MPSRRIQGMLPTSNDLMILDTIMRRAKIAASQLVKHHTCDRLRVGLRHASQQGLNSRPVAARRPEGAFAIGNLRASNAVNAAIMERQLENIPRIPQRWGHDLFVSQMVRFSVGFRSAANAEQNTVNCFRTVRYRETGR